MFGWWILKLWFWSWIFPFEGYFCLQLGGVMEGTSGGVVSMADVTGGF